jgi:hypothetical protein
MASDMPTDRATSRSRPRFAKVSHPFTRALVQARDSWYGVRRETSNSDSWFDTRKDALLTMRDRDLENDSFSSWPGLTRPSTPFLLSPL